MGIGNEVLVKPPGLLQLSQHSPVHETITQTKKNTHTHSRAKHKTDSWLHISIITRGTTHASTQVYFNSSTLAAPNLRPFHNRRNPEPLRVQLHTVSWGGTPFIPVVQQRGSWSSMLPLPWNDCCSTRLDRTRRPWDPIQSTGHRIPSTVSTNGPVETTSTFSAE